MAGTSFALYTLRVGIAKDIAAELDPIFGEGGSAPVAGLVRIVPIERFNALLVISQQRAVWSLLRGTSPGWRRGGDRRRWWTAPWFRGTVVSQQSRTMDEPATISSLSELVAAVQRGSRAALKRLYELERRRLYGVALRIARRPDVAADALQDAFVQVWQNAASFSQERGDAAAWLTGIVRYRALDAVRKLGREVLSDDPTLGDRAEEPDILSRLDAVLLRDALRRCLGELDDNQRRCIVLAFVEGLSHAEIARRLPAPLGSVKSWVRRGLISLRSCLGP